MRALLTGLIAAASTVCLAQAPTHISEVAKLIRTIPDLPGSYQEFEYEGIRVFGNPEITEYRAALKLVMTQLTDGETIWSLTAPQPLRLGRDDYDVEVKTCSPSCNQSGAASGRAFSLKRTPDGRLLFDRIIGWREVKTGVRPTPVSDLTAISNMEYHPATGSSQVRLS